AEMSRHATSILGQLMESPVTEEALGGSFEQAAARSAGLGLAPEAEQFVWLAVVHSLRPNMVYDAEATQAAIDDAVSKVVPVQITIRQNQVIVRAGDPITAEHVSILEQLGVQSERGMAAPLAGILLFVLITTYLFIEYLRRYHHGVLADNRFMLLLGLAAVLVAVLAKVVTMISIGERPEINALSGYLIPAAVGPMLVAVLVEPRIGYLMAGVLAFYVGLLTQGNQLAFALTAFVGGSVGVFRMSQLSQTSDLARSGLHVALGNAATVVATGLLAGTMDAQQLGVGSLLGVLNGFLSTVLVIGLLPYLESAFSITSMIKLLELSNPNQELLRRLLVEAPGTYHHSILVGNLAEAAAQAVGAQPLLVRVGAYYHDIGKLKRPYFFVENQMSFENPHDKIAPSLSALIITSHIKDGVEMAHQARLPRVIVDFIEQHHGTSLVKYFYSRALEEDAERRVSEESFRYEGPKPQSKEAAIVMLADAVEAAVRSLAEPTPNKVEAMVRSIIRDKLNDRQLEECELTFRDLDVIAESFLKTLGGIYHTRVEYPENLAREFEDRRRKRGNSSAQSAE
ncbi:MAG: HDIG domain-containing protein, partial [Syntrophomonadaceae bacterium]|nr:HDIG domain-containing protein [Syntrophomonadaceae bacterium]